jgi:hypothetical protein
MKTKWLGICALLFFSLQSMAQLKLGDQPTVLNKAVALDVQGSSNKQGLWLPRVSDTSITGIRSLNPPNGLIIYHSPSGKMLLRSNNAWVSYTTSGVVNVYSGPQFITGQNLSVQTGTAAGTGNDFNIVADNATSTLTFNLPDASATSRGVITTGAQTVSGLKTFNNGVAITSGREVHRTLNLVLHRQLQHRQPPTRTYPLTTRVT